MLHWSWSKRDLLHRNLKHWRSIGHQRPATHPAAVVIIINADDLKKAGIDVELNAIALMEVHERVGFLLGAELDV